MANRKTLFEPENVVLGFIICCVIGLIIHGKTLIKIPRYYTIEITDSDGLTKWIFVKEEDRLGAYGKGEDNELWEPPCIADENEAEVAFEEDLVNGDETLSESVFPLYEVVRNVEVVPAENQPLEFQFFDGLTGDENNLTYFG